MRSLSSHALHTHAYRAWIAAAAIGYLVLELTYIRHLPLITDEFDGAYDVYRLRTQIPYLDFAPYKTVLGYYAQLPGLLLASDVWSGLLNVKTGLAVLNAACVALAAGLAGVSLSRAALALALPSWLLVSNWLERSSDLRVDMLTAWPGLFSLLCLLRGRALTAGTLAGLSFLVSQKGIYYVAAGMAAALAPLLLAWTRADTRRAAARDALRFALGAAVVIAPYLALFSLVSSPERAARTTFLSHHAIAFTEIYPNIRKFWRQTLTQNPAFYTLAALGLLALGGAVLGHLRTAFGQRQTERAPAITPVAERDARLFVYGCTLTAACIWHKQPWPYFFVLLLPTAFLLAAAAVELLGGLQAPLALDTHAGKRTVLRHLRSTVLGGILLASWVMPTQRAAVVLRESQAYQRHMVELASALVEPGDHYLAAFDLLYDREQSPQRLRRLSIGRRAQLARAKPEAIADILDEFKRSPPKLLVRSERFRGMPRSVRSYLHANYAHFWGNIELYAPRFFGTRALPIAFAGHYRVALSRHSAALTIDGRTLQHDDVIVLARGEHSISASSPGRLHLQPPERVARTLDPRFRAPGELIGRGYNL